jgi:hypothetical protein
MDMFDRAMATGEKLARAEVGLDRDERDRQYLQYLQERNCVRCRFGDPKTAGTGEPCCTRMQGPRFNVYDGCDARKDK